MSLEELISGNYCPISGMDSDDLRIRKYKKNIHPPGYYASEWEVKNKQPQDDKPKKEKQERQPPQKRIKRTPEEQLAYRKLCNRRNYNPDKKRQYYLTRKEKLKQTT